MITKDIAINSRHRQEFQHKTAKYKGRNNHLPIRCRVNGKCKTWKTRPNDWELPVKFGLRDCFYISPANCNDWEIIA